MYLSRFPGAGGGGAAGLRGPWGGRSGRGEPGGNPGETVACHSSFLSLPRPKEGQGHLTCFSCSCGSRARQGWSSPFAVASGCEGQGCSFYSCIRGGDRGPELPTLAIPTPEEGTGCQCPTFLPFSTLSKDVVPIPIAPYIPWLWSYLGHVPNALFLPAPVEELGAGPAITGCHQFGAGGEPWEPKQSSEPCPRCPPCLCLSMPPTHCVRVTRQPSPPVRSVLLQAVGKTQTA